MVKIIARNGIFIAAKRGKKVKLVTKREREKYQKREREKERREKRI